MNSPGRTRATFDALLFISQRGGWVNYISGDRICEIQLVESEGGLVLYCKQDRQVHQLYRLTPELTMILLVRLFIKLTLRQSVSVKQTDDGFLQVTNNGRDRITLGMKFRNDMEARSFMGLLHQCSAPGITVGINFHYS